MTNQTKLSFVGILRMGQGQHRDRASNSSHHARWGRNEVRQNHVGRDEDPII